MILTPDSTYHHPSGMTQYPESSTSVYGDNSNNTMYMEKVDRNVYESNVDITSTSLHREPSLNLGNIYVVKIIKKLIFIKC